MKRTVRVTIEKEYEIEIMPSMFLGMSEEEFLNEFRTSLWEVESMEGVFEYAARMIAYYGDGSHDGIGNIGPDYQTFPKVPDVRYKELYDDCEVEFI